MVGTLGSSHELMIEQGRHYDLPEEYRTCAYCEVCIEYQIHFILVCPLYKELRTRYLSNINENISHIDMFYRLMTSNSILCVRYVAMFIYSILLLKGNSILTYICSYYAVILTLLYVSLQLHTVHCVFVWI